MPVGGGRSNQRSWCEVIQQVGFYALLLTNIANYLSYQNSSLGSLHMTYLEWRTLQETGGTSMKSPVSGSDPIERRETPPKGLV